MQSTAKPEPSVLPQEENGTAATQPEGWLVPLDQVFSAIRADSRRNPMNYLREAIIPGGGE